MNYEQTILDIVIPLVANQDSIVTRTDVQNNDITVFVYGESEDIGRLIGSGGRVAQAIREVANVAAKLDGKRLFVKFDSYKEEDE